MPEHLSEYPCKACLSHDELDERIDMLVERNADEHRHIGTAISNIASDVKWMNIIAKWILGSLFGYFIAIGYYLLTVDDVSHQDFEEVLNRVDEGNKLHYMNENHITNIDTRLKKIEHER